MSTELTWIFKFLLSTYTITALSWPPPSKFTTFSHWPLWTGPQYLQLSKIIATKYSASLQAKSIISTNYSHVIINYCTCDWHFITLTFTVEWQPVIKDLLRNVKQRETYLKGSTLKKLGTDLDTILGNFPSFFVLLPKTSDEQFSVIMCILWGDSVVFRHSLNISVLHDYLLHGCGLYT